MKHYIVEAVVSVRVRMPVKVKEFSELTDAVNSKLDLCFWESRSYTGTESEITEYFPEDTDVVDWDLQDEDDEEDGEC